MKALLDRLLGAAVILVISALLLRWAWDLVRPLLPVIATLLGLALLLAFSYRQWRNRYW